ncbi:uncharacterized protein BYT42DRAFT_87434 [Radiomyces spectabilis]|uniref:uncharacterized protein n=1 Tax=Radiomyces spectabilis TaxID=64574 RepID=UPI00221F4020|nr:uncharacterized protein BYT42DRAFT_87434 [Radiomyces spectabilis]KAI8370407.1 hypothetical protein BYT42DRAFT_87434 [Radiomyces spectabilis]
MFDSDEEDYDCPLCMEELDIADRNFRPCTCGYQICRFCWHHIRENLNGRCPACRREYSDDMVEFEPIGAEEISRIKREKKEKERQQKDMEAVNRRHLANMRVVQKNLVYVIGLHPKLATEETIRSQDFFGQFGKIAKVVINKRPVAPTSHASGSTSMQPSAAVYVTYVRKEDAAKTIHAVDGSIMAGRILRASYGTTKYCTYYLRNMTCPNPSCLYLHEPGEEADTISKEELATGKHRMRDQMSTDAESRQSQHSHPPPPPPPSSMSSSDFPPVSASHRKPATLESVATISYKTPIRQDSGSKPSSPAVHSESTSTEEDRSALPATASWAKLGSTPSTPVLKSGVLPERALTPDNFGPPLSVAVAASQKPQQQVSVTKRKSEKKKRKEQRKLGLSDLDSITSTEKSDADVKSRRSPSVSEAEEETAGEEESGSVSAMRRPRYHDALVNFVLGDAFDELLCLPSLEEPEEAPVGVSALHDTTGSSDEDTPVTPDTIEPLSMSPLEFLTNATPTPTYTGTFNPFAHQILRSTGNLFDSPMRKHSRFGFAQI